MIGCRLQNKHADIGDLPAISLSGRPRLLRLLLLAQQSRRQVCVRYRNVYPVQQSGPTACTMRGSTDTCQGQWESTLRPYLLCVALSGLIGLAAHRARRVISTRLSVMISARLSVIATTVTLHERRNAHSANSCVRLLCAVPIIGSRTQEPYF
jgi:hypothetical protein